MKTLGLALLLAIGAGAVVAEENADSVRQLAGATGERAPALDPEAGANSGDLQESQPALRPTPRTGSPVTFRLAVATPEGDRGLDRGGATALAIGDFDEDGVHDLVIGGHDADGPWLALHPGNLWALSQHLQTGSQAEPPFLGAQLFEAPVRPDLLAAGDFDNDGRLDLAVARRGDPALHLLPGRSDRGFGEARSIALAGSITAWTSGEINSRDVLADLAVAVTGPTGSAVLVFEGPGGALEHEPELVGLPAPARALALGQIVGDAARDLALVAGEELVIVAGRDRLLTSRPSDRARVARAAVERIELGRAFEALAIGDFVRGPETQQEIGLLASDGTLVVLGEPAEDPAGVREWLPRIVREAGAEPEVRRATPQLLGARVSGGGADDLVVLDGARASLRVVQQSDGAAAGTTEVDPGGEIEVPLGSPPLAVLPLRLNPDALADLVFLSAETGPGVALTSIAATIVVDSALDVATIDGQCTLREAIANANANSDTTGGDCAAGSGLDTISFGIAGGGLPATIAVLTAYPLIVDPVTIDGTTQGCASPPCITLDGTLSANASGLRVTAGSTTIRGLVIHSFDVDGVLLSGGAGNVIEGNFVGTDPSGTLARANLSDGLDLENSANNTIGGTAPGAGNLISGNALNGILVNDPLSTGNDILGNRIGTDVTGTFAIANGSDGVEIDDGSASTVGGTTPAARNVISGNTFTGIFLDDPQCTDNVIVGNFIGTDVTGTLAVANNSVGVLLSDNADDNRIGSTAVGAGNLLSGNVEEGCQIQFGASATRIQGNFIGIDVTGTQPLPNGDTGIQFSSGGPNTLIGGTAAGAGNVISNSGGAGTSVFVADQTQVLGNLFGTDASGTVPMANALSGVIINESADCTVGGPTAAERNVISGNLENGIYLVDPPTFNAVVQGNYVGTDVTGTVALGNGLTGIRVAGASNNKVGGSAPGEGNLIVGPNGNGMWIDVQDGNPANGNLVQGNLINTDHTGTQALGSTTFSGIDISSTASNTIGGTGPGAANVINGCGSEAVLIRDAATQNTVQGNRIGTDVTGTVVLGNPGRGVLFDNGALSNVLGGTAAGAGNVIAGSGQQGVAVMRISRRNGILRNSIHTNGLLGIDLAANGITPNDALDSDTGSNDLQNYPVLSSASATSAAVTVAGQLSSRANQNYRVEFFASPSCDPAGHGEGERYLGFTMVTTNAAGTVPLNVVLSPSVGDGDAVTATATDVANTTSELSACVAASCSSNVVFPQVLRALSAAALGWTNPADVRFVKGDLAAVASYAILGGAAYNGVTSLDISLDAPDPGEGLYYLVKPLGCGSWQTTLGAQPARDLALP